MQTPQQMLNETLQELQDDRERTFKVAAKNKIAAIIGMQAQIRGLQEGVVKLQKELREMTLELVDGEDVLG